MAKKSAPTPEPSAVPARAAQSAPPRRATAAPMKVRATKDGYYDDKYRRVGDVFTIDGTPRADMQAQADEAKATEEDTAKPAAFSDKWMEPVDAGTPEKITSSGEALRKAHDETLAGRGAGPTGDTSVLGE